MKTVEILKDVEIIRSIECEDHEADNLLSRARLDASVMTRDKEGNFTARFKPDPIEEVPDEEPV